MIYGERIRLRAPEREDVPLFASWINDPEVREGLQMYLPMSIVMEEKWLEGVFKSPPNEHPMVIDVQQKDDWVSIGTVGLFSFSELNRSAEVGIMIGNKAYWNQGYGTETMQLILKHGFLTLNLNRIFLRVYSYNKRAVRAYEKSGYVLEGTLRQARYHEGVYHDEHIMGVLREDWEKGAD